jgi:membrane peptidoglycan carboxypeptidase
VKLGPSKVVDLAKQMGINAELEAHCSSVLGTGLVTPMEMASAYSTFADGGVHRSPIVVTRVELADGTVRRYTPTDNQILTPDQAGKVRYAMQQVLEPGGTGAAANIGRPAAGKTGTTQKNVASWFVGYTPKLTASVWMGFTKGSIPMTNVHGVEVQGGRFPAEMWRKFMVEATKNTPPVDFPEVDLDSGNPLDPAFGLGAPFGPQTTSTTTDAGDGRAATASAGQQQYTPTTTTPPSTTTPPFTTTQHTTAPVTTGPLTGGTGGNGQGNGQGNGGGRGNGGGGGGGGPNGVVAP